MRTPKAKAERLLHHLSNSVTYLPAIRGVLTPCKAS